MQQQLQASTRLPPQPRLPLTHQQAIANDDIPSDLRAAVLGLRQRKPVDYNVCRV